MDLISSGRHHAIFQFGELQVISLRDGCADMPATLLRDENGTCVGELPASVPVADGNLRLSVNAFLVTDGTRSVLIDTGASNAWLPTVGALHDALDEAGIDRGTVTDVAITHRHVDHVGGLIAPDGSEAFPNLQRVWIGAADAAVFTDRLEPIRDRVVPITEQVAINDWATAIPTPGHTPGHTVYDITSSTGHLLAWGDTVHVPTLQFAQPEVTWGNDGNQPQARNARAALLDRLTQTNHYIAGAHLDSPGIARVTPATPGYTLTYLAPTLP